MEASKRGDELFTQWWSVVEPRLISLGERYLASAEAARDLAQDVAIAAYRGFDSFRDQNHFNAWVLNRAKWFALDQIRSSRRASRFLWEGVSPPDREAPLYLTAWLGEVAEALDELPQAQKDALKLAVEGYSSHEIALRLGVTEATVRSLRRHARIRLLERLIGRKEVP
jgi:RNA polymerase sigma factor (sigma-70 family)